MSKPKMYQFLGDGKSGEVAITYDPSVIKKHTSKVNESKHIGKIGNDSTNMGIASAMGKDERIFKMLAAYDRMELVTIESIAKYLNVSYATAKRYAKETNIMVFDNKAKKYTTGRKPKSFSEEAE